VTKLKATAWFAAGMAFGELVLRWPIHFAYLAVIAGMAYKIWA
jgi:hypothetical protein